jgi:hypothetical protein
MSGCFPPDQAIGTPPALYLLNRRQSGPVQRLFEEGSTMTMMFAQASSFALSAAAALAILIGVIDQPQIAVSISGSPVGPLGAAAMSPAVSPMA